MTKSALAEVGSSHYLSRTDPFTTRLENVVGQASRLPLGRLAPVFSRARRPFIAGRRPAPLCFRGALRSRGCAEKDMNRALSYLGLTLLKRKALRFCSDLRRPTRLIGIAALLSLAGVIYSFRD